MNPLVSVVMPVYNGEDFLNRSIRSFLKQTLKEIELIVVNDGSTDNTRSIIEQYASKDSRIHLINFDENRGNLIARKTGALIASGDYIMFLDADDALFLNACKQAWIRVTETEADIFQFNSEIVFSEKDFPEKEFIQQLLQPFEGVLTGERILRGCYELKLFSHTIWNKIYRREVCQEAYRNVPDIYLNLGEDEFAFFFISFFSKKYVGDPQLTLYYYTYGSGISTQRLITLKQIRLLSKCMEISVEIKKFLSREGKLDYFKPAVESISLKNQQTLFKYFEQYISNDNKSSVKSAFSSVLEYCEPLDLIRYLEPRFFDKPVIIAEGLLSSTLAKPIQKPIKTIGTYYSRLYNGGVERVLSLIIPLWVEMGYQVILFTDEPPNELDYEITVPYTRVVLPKPISFDDYQQKASALDNALRKHDVDLMIYNKWLDPHLLWDMLVCKQAGTAFYIYTHGTIDLFRSIHPDGQQYYVQLPSIYRLADCVISLTEMDAAFWSQFAFRTHLISNPCSLPDNTPEKRKNRRNRIIWVGRISEEKQPVEAVKILVNVLEKMPSAELYIVGIGEPNMVKHALDYARKQKILDHITLVGYQMEVGQFYDQSDILLFTSAFEGFPMTLFEAQSFGLPIVMYELPYLTLVQGSKGIVAVEQHDVEGAANSIVDILTNAEKYALMSQKAYENASEISSIDLKEKWHEIFMTAEKNLATNNDLTSPAALRLALASWTRFNVESLHKARMQTQINTPSNTDISEAVNQAIQVKMVNMSILEASVHLVKTVARRVLGKNLSDRIHLFRVRIRGKLA